MIEDSNAKYHVGSQSNNHICESPRYWHKLYWNCKHVSRSCTRHCQHMTCRLKSMFLAGSPCYKYKCNCRWCRYMWFDFHIHCFHLNIRSSLMILCMLYNNCVLTFAVLCRWCPVILFVTSLTLASVAAIAVDAVSIYPTNVAISSTLIFINTHLGRRCPSPLHVANLAWTCVAAICVSAISICTANMRSNGTFINIYANC